MQVTPRRTRAAKSSRAAKPLSATSSGTGDYGVVQGQTAKEAALVRVRFRDQPTLLDLPVIQSWSTYVVNLYVGLFPPGWVPVEVSAYDAAGRRLAGCALDPPAGPVAQCQGG